MQGFAYYGESSGYGVAYMQKLIKNNIPSNSLKSIDLLDRE